MNYLLKGVNSDSDTCECCGKTGLKKVMWLETLDTDGNGTGVVTPMGVNCAAKALGFKSEFDSFEQLTKSVELREKKAAAVKSAKQMAIEFNDEIAVIKSGNGYITVRGKAFDANPNRYGTPVLWVTK